MDLNRIRDAVGQDWDRVEALIRGALESDIDLLNSVNANVLSNSGKQLRPILSLLAARACSGGHPVEASFRFAAASELLHNATLFHDDVADSSDERRGVPTLRALMGPSVSVLVGDFWLVRAVRLVLGEGVNEVSGRVVQLFAKTLNDLAEGEMLQLEKARMGDTSEKDCLRIMYCKTASLFETAVLTAAISVGADKAMEQACRRYARALGLAFQIGDDILDYRYTSGEIGKPAGSDAGEGLITLPLLGAFLSAPEREDEIRGSLPHISGMPGMREEIISYVRENGGIEYAESRLKDFVAEALEALKELPECEETRFLGEIAVHLGERHS